MAFSSVGLADQDIDELENLEQNLFKDLTRDLGATLNYKTLAPANSFGTLGFDIGVEASGTHLDSEAFEEATSENVPGTLWLPKVRIMKGLPFGFDIGAMYSAVPASNIKLFGAELRYALIDGGLISPSVSLRGSYSVLNGVDDLDITTKGLELSVSKGFSILTPYAGVGAVWVDGDPNNVVSTSSGQPLDRESMTLTKYYIGLDLDLGLATFAAEAEQTGDNTTTSAKFGLRF
jgi:hypothetical protein